MSTTSASHSNNSNSSIDLRRIRTSKSMNDDPPEAVPEKEEEDEEISIEVLVKKIAKCERLMNSKKKKKDETSLSKLKKKRRDYLVQLGELAYQAAVQSSSMDRGRNQDSSALQEQNDISWNQIPLGPAKEEQISSDNSRMVSPKGVHEERIASVNLNDPSRLSKFQDSLAIFEDDYVKEEEEEQKEEERHCESPKEEQDPAVVLPPPVLEDDHEQDEPEERQATDESPSSEEDMEQFLEALPTEEEMQEQQDKDKGVDREKGNETTLALDCHKAQTQKIGNVTTDTDENDEKDQATPFDETPESLMEEHDHFSSSVLPLPVSQPSTSADSSTNVEAQRQENPQSEVIGTIPSAPPAEQDYMNSPSIIDTRRSMTTSNTGTTASNNSSRSNSQHASPKKKEEFPLDGEGSVNKLRAMFDSPLLASAGSNKPKRSWKPRKASAMPPPAPFETNAEIIPVPTATADIDGSTYTVTMKVSDEGKSSRPRKSSVVTLHQAVMTSSVHDIDSPLVALVTLFPESMYECLPQQNRCLLIFQSLGLEPLYVDGSNPQERDRRNQLFEISGKRGQYPQLFVRSKSNPSGQLEFFADFDKIERLNDANLLKEAIEQACQ